MASTIRTSRLIKVTRSAGFSACRMRSCAANIFAYLPAAWRGRQLVHAAVLVIDAPLDQPFRGEPVDDVTDIGSVDARQHCQAALIGPGKSSMTASTEYCRGTGSS